MQHSSDCKVWNKSQACPLSLSPYDSYAFFAHELVSQLWSQVLWLCILVKENKAKVGPMETGDDKKRGTPCPVCGGKDYKPKYNNNKNPEQLCVECTNCHHMFQLHPRHNRIEGATRRRRSRNPHETMCSSSNAIVAKRWMPTSTARITTTPCNRDTSAWTQSARKSSPLSRSLASNPNLETAKGERV